MSHDVVLSVEDVEHGKLRRHNMLIDSNLSPKAGIGLSKTSQPRSIGMLVSGPSMAHSVGSKRKVCPGILPGCRQTKRSLGRISHLFLVMGRFAVRAVLNVLQRIVPGQSDGMAMFELPLHVGREIEAVRPHACEVHHAPYKHVERNGNNLIFHLIYICIGSQREVELSGKAMCPCQSHVQLLRALGT